LRRRFRIVEWEKVIDCNSDIDREVIDLRFQKSISHKSITIRLKYWDDRWLWVDARKAGKLGWELEVSAEGRLRAERTSADIIESVELTDSIISENNEDYRYRVTEIWKKVLILEPIKLIT
jgi:hypothetical protein